MRTPEDLLQRARRLRPPDRVILAAKRFGALGSVGLVGYVLWRGALRLDVSQLHPLALLGALGFSLVAWLGLALGWTAISPLPSRQSSLSVWARTQALRYLPGVGWAQAARAPTVRTTTAGKVTSVFVEAAATVAMALAVGGSLYAWWHGPVWYLTLAAPAAVAAGGLMAGNRLGIPSRRVLGAMACYLLSWSAYGLATVMSQRAVGGNAPALEILGAGCLAWAFGFLTIITPGGMGARELAYVALLTPVLSPGKLAGAALVNRVSYTLAELAVLLVVVLLGRRRVASEDSGAVLAEVDQLAALDRITVPEPDPVPPLGQVS